MLQESFPLFFSQILINFGLYVRGKPILNHLHFRFAVLYKAWQFSCHLVPGNCKSGIKPFGTSSFNSLRTVEFPSFMYSSITADVPLPIPGNEVKSVISSNVNPLVSRDCSCFSKGRYFKCIFSFYFHINRNRF